MADVASGADPFEDRCHAMADRITRLMQPAPEDAITEELFKLNALTKRRSEDDVEGAVRFEAYAELLRGYPADVAVDVVRWWPRQSGSVGMWWPSGNELVRACEIRTAERRAIIAALKRCAPAAALPRPMESAESRAESRARVAQIVDDLRRRMGFSAGAETRVAAAGAEVARDVETVEGER